MYGIKGLWFYSKQMKRKELNAMYVLRRLVMIQKIQNFSTVKLLIDPFPKL